jgi:phage-related protein
VVAEGFKVADAYVDVVSEVDRDELESSAASAGLTAGRVVSRNMATGFTRSWSRDSGGRFRKAGDDSGQEFGDGVGEGAGKKRGLLGVIGGVLAGGLIGGMGRAMAGGASAIGSSLPGMLSNPYILGVVAAAGAVMAPALAAGLAGALIGGAGLGVIGLGAFLLREEPAVTKAASRLAEKAQFILGRAAKPLIQPFVTSLGLLEGMLRRLEPAFNQAFKAVAPSIVPLTKGLTSLVENAMPGFLKLIQASGPFLAELAPSLGVLGEGLGEFFSVIADAGPESLIFFKDLIMWVTATIVWIGHLISWTAKAYTAVRSFFTSLPGWAASAWSAVTNFFSAVGDKLSALGAWFAALPGKFMGWLSAAGTAVTTAGAAVLNWFASLPGKVGSFLAALPGNVARAFVSTVDQMLYWVGYGIGTVIKFFLDLPGRARSAVSTLWSAIQSAFFSARDGGKNAAKALVDGAINFLVSLPGRARSAVASLWGSMTGAFSSAKSGASSMANQIVSGAINVIKTLPGKAKSAASGLRSAILSAGSGAASWLYSTGQNIIRGMINGITSMVGAAIRAVKNAVGSVISGAKDALGIGSPSKVFRDQVGRWLLPGAVEGVKRTVGATRRRISSIVRGIVPGVGGDTERGGYGRAWDPPRGGDSPGMIYIGNITLDASKMKTIQDVVDTVNGIVTTARSYRAATVPAPGR